MARPRTRSCSATGRARRRSKASPATAPGLPELVELHERIALPLRPARVACLALNTAGLDDEAALAAIAGAAEETGLPADDPVRYGAGPLLDSVLSAFEAQASAATADH